MKTNHQLLSRTLLRNLFLGVLIIAALIFVGCTQQTQKPDVQLPVDSAVIFKSSTCGCCGIYSQYMEKEDINVQVNNVVDMSSVKAENNIPAKLQSCHTTMIGDYFVEGHVPLEAVQKLLEEKPDIAGIALPGMPSGSPGMPGPKNEPWVIYAVHGDGSYEEFMTI